MDGNHIVRGSGHGAGLDSVCTQGLEEGGGSCGVGECSGGSGGLDRRCIIFGWVRVLSLRR